eukprot:9021391-Pyramimonas_sp.AAC.1
MLPKYSQEACQGLKRPQPSVQMMLLVAHKFHSWMGLALSPERWPPPSGSHAAVCALANAFMERGAHSAAPATALIYYCDAAPLA